MTLHSRQTSEKIKKMVHRHPELLKGDSAYHLQTLTKVPQMASIMWEVKRGLEAGREPFKVLGGSGEVFLLNDRKGAPLAIFKPTFRTLAKDEMLTREVAAFLLDHHHFAGVPPIVMTTLSHPLFGEERRGTCQLYMAEGVRALERLIDPHAHPFSAQSLRRIAQLDIRLLNGDRHLTNLLVDGPNRVVPIDHQLVLPSIYSGVHLQWREWPQSKTPFTEEEKRYIEELPLEKDYRLLTQELRFSTGVGRLYLLATALLQAGVNMNLSPFEISEFLFPPLGVKGAQMWRYSPFFEAVERVHGDPERDWKGFCEEAKREMEGMVADAFSQSQI